jgi:hypothetical protein
MTVDVPVAATMTICRPDVVEPPEAPARLAAREPLRPGARLVLVDNGKPNARELLELLAGELCARAPIGDVETVTKPAAGHPLEDEVAAEVAERADLVVAGLGDCGSCSACSLRDAIAFERLGVPATVVITDAFVGHVARFAVTFGLPGYHALVVRHPVSSKDSAQLRGLASRVVDAAVVQLTGP